MTLYVVPGASASARARSARSPAAPALAASVLGFFVITLDATVVNVALPSIRADLGTHLEEEES